jgi:predicted kinase
MSTVVIMKGLPGSGKSTYCKDFIKRNPTYKRVCRDDLRLMLHDQSFAPKKEKFITKIENEIIFSILEKGFNVIIDSTNLNTSRVNSRNNKIKEKFPKTDFLTKSFIDIPIEECIKNDLKRPNSVGSDVIYGMHERYLLEKHDMRDYTLSITEKQKSLFIFDIDGSLAEMHDRGPFEWEKVKNDHCRKDIANMLSNLKENGNTVYLFSGRSDICRKETEEWLKENNIEYDGLFMRKDGDNRKDSIIKRELFMENVYNKGFYVCGVIDDRPQIIRLWKELGITTFNVDSRYWLTEF